MKMLSVGVEDKFASIIDEFIAKSGRYSSRSEFLKDSIRRNLDEQTKSEEWRKKFMESILDLTKHDPAIDPIFKCESAGYWSSTPYAAYPDDGAWGVYFGGGGVSGSYRGNGCYVRPCRQY
jgi:Arc/MetJ-type ribon-helix-helix transcriptional regulator